MTLVIVFVGCDRLLGREAPDAGSLDTAASPTGMIAPRDGSLSPAALASALAQDDEEEEAEAGAASPAPVCPLDLHPYYCRYRCRDYASRSLTLHARRIKSPARAGLGGCGAYRVFAEDERVDGGLGRGLVEYFDTKTNELVGAVDHRRSGCNKYGAVPTCKLEVNWGPPHGGGLGDLIK